MKTGSRALLKLGALIALVTAGALAAAFTPLGEYLSRDGVGTAIEWLRGSSAAPLVYIGVYAGATALAIPGSILTLAGGAMFGVFWGTIYTTVGANLGANAAFAIARYLGRDGIERLAGARLERLDRATTDHGFRGLLTLRLIPAVPFNALNFGSGLTAVRWPVYALATVVGIFPGTLVYTMFADALLGGSVEASRDALVRVLVAGALLVLLSFLPTIAKKLGVKVPGAATSTAALGLIVSGLALAPALGAQALPDHAAFSAVLAEVVERPLVDYQKLHDNRAPLDAYLETMARVTPAALESASRDARLAFWINAYNACMLRQVIDAYPIQKDGRLLSRIKNAVTDRPENSVWQIPDIFTGKRCLIAGEDRSQDDIEHTIIRPMGDARVHFAANCAAASCPPLWPEAYTAEDVDEQLDRAVDNLVRNPAHFSVEQGLPTTVRLNRVLDWYKDDFGGIDGLRTFLAPYVADDIAAMLTDPSTRIDFFEYDWTLNDVGR